MNNTANTVLKHLLLSMLLPLVASQLRSQTLVTSPSNGSSGIFHDSIGYSFTVGASSLRVSALGVYDAGLDGLDTSNTVGLWTEGGTLLRSAVFAAGTGATLSSNFRWTSVTPFDLISGQTYRIGVFSLFGEYRYSGFVPSGGFTISGDVTLIGAVRSNDFSLPAFPNSSPLPGQVVIGANATYSAIPEASTYAAIFGLTVLGFAWYQRRNTTA